jgi:hypothetical protein
MNVKRYGTGIKPYRSFDENRFFRGAAGTFRVKDFEVTALAVLQKNGCQCTLGRYNLSNGEIDVIGVSSLEISGLHNTNSLNAR